MVLQNVSAEVTIPEALLHTIISMAIVFSVLILISFIIFLLKFVPMLLSREKKQKTEIRTTPAQAPASPGKTPTDAPADDTQLVAVITAAIAAQRPAFRQRRTDWLSVLLKNVHFQFN